MDPYIGLPVVNVRRQETKRVLTSLNSNLIAFEDPECIEGSALVEDYISANRNIFAVTVMRDISRALSQLHTAGLVHGAVDKKNIIVDFQTGRARLLPNQMVQVRRVSRAGSLPIGSGSCVETVAPVHFTMSSNWDNALEDVWALTVVGLQMLHPHGKLNETTSPVLKLLWLSRFFNAPSNVRKNFLHPILSSADLPDPFVYLMFDWWLNPSKFKKANPSDLAASLNVPVDDFAVVRSLPDRPQSLISQVLRFVINDLRLQFIDMDFVNDAVSVLEKNFDQGLLIEVTAVMLAVKMSLHLHLKQAEVVCARIAKQFLTLNNVQRVYALETWFLTRQA